MIAKIEKLKNIGNFEDYNAYDDVALKHLNIIYAENGAGKTTLARVLQSLATNDGSIIERHKRIGAVGNSEVIIKDDANHQHIYNGTRWNNPIPEIEVFDAHFVANNVYSGFEMNSDHHKGLYQFVVGATDVATINKIEKVKNLIAAHNVALGQQGNMIKVIAKCQDLAKILSLTPRATIDSDVAAKASELSISNNMEQIRKQELPQPIQFPSPILDLDTTRSVLGITVDGIGKEYLELVDTHLGKLEKAGLKDGTDWVYRGFTAKGDNCPFCGQRLEGAAELIDGYNQYFSKAYRDALEKAKALMASLERINIANFILQLTAQYSKIESSLKYWNTVIVPETPLPSFPLEKVKFEEKYNQLLLVIRQKVGNPVGVQPDDALEAFSTAIEEIKTLCEAINQYVKNYTGKITALKATIRPAVDVEKELQELKLIKARFEEPLLWECKRYAIMEGHVSKWNTIKEHLHQEQKAASAAMFQQYGMATNDFLQNVFMTQFRIADVKDIFKGASKRPNLEYTLTFNGTPIIQGDDGSSNTSFKNVLSEGDKNTIAFSFFLAKLVQDPHLNDKIVVFDDPLTSLDQNRRQATIDQLVLLQNRCKQLIVLSHNFHFLIDLNARGEINKRNKKVLIIVKGASSSEITPFELKQKWMDKYKCSILAMEDFINHPQPTNQEDAINSIRLTIELMLKLKFGKYLTNQDDTFGNTITELERSSCTFMNSNKADVIAKLRSLNSISWRVHHATVEEMTMYQEKYLTMTEAVNYVRMALKMLYHEL